MRARNLLCCRAYLYNISARPLDTNAQAEKGAGRGERQRQAGKLELAGRESEGPTH